MRGEFSDFRKRLLRWFDREKRDLPWRAETSLYRTVVSEFMLQQTQVETVLPYFDRWMKRFPDFASLASASEEAVLREWEGLGYYSRARNLHRLARSIVEKGVPRDTGEWRQRPGIGPYTAAAISSIAQGLPEPVIDGNVIRVLCRLNNDAGPVKSSAEAQKRLLPLARELMDDSRPGDFNEALMELGAVVCRKVRPACLLCPVSDHCRARAAGTQESIPVIPRKATLRREVHRAWVRDGDRLLLHFNNEKASRLAGMAELPTLPKAPPGPPLLTRSRGISSERIRESIHSISPADPLLGSCLSRPETRWIALGELASVSLSGPHRRWIRELLRQGH